MARRSLWCFNRKDHDFAAIDTSWKLFSHLSKVFQGHRLVCFITPGVEILTMILVFTETKSIVVVMINLVQKNLGRIVAANAHQDLKQHISVIGFDDADAVTEFKQIKSRHDTRWGSHATGFQQDIFNRLRAAVEFVDGFLQVICFLIVELFCCPIRIRTYLSLFNHNSGY